MIIEDEVLFKDEDIEKEEDRHTYSALKKRHKWKFIKETFKKFRACLKRDPRDKRKKLSENLPVLTSDNYEVNNIYGVRAFFENQTSLGSKSLNEDAVEITKGYL